MLRLAAVVVIAPLMFAAGASAQGIKQYDGEWTGSARISKTGCLSNLSVKIAIKGGAVTGETENYGEKNPNKLIGVVKGKVDAAGNLSWTATGDRKSKGAGTFADGKFSVSDTTDKCVFNFTLQRKP